jgi:putative aldouronate transport system substrate-binding protein
MNTNKQLYNLIVFGIEGKQYNKTGENSIELIPDSQYSGFTWMMGCQFNAYLLPGQADDVWEETKRLNAEAYEAPTLGFVFDRTNVKTEIANIDAVVKQDEQIQSYGLLELDDFLARMEESRTKINEAGLEAYKNELQSQIDAWKASR